MFGRNTVRLSSALLSQAKEAAERAGYSSVDEFVAHVVERELARLASPASHDLKDEITKQLKGLGYLE